jgi:O-antigen/teichoic acid export membrane protein
MKLPSIILSSAIAIYMAYHGFGVWSLIWMYVLQNFFWALFHWIFGDWSPKIHFNYSIFRKHIGFGYRLTLVEILNNITANIYQIVIGRFYNPLFVGYFTQSVTLRQIPVSNIYSSIVRVVFPVFSKMQDNRKQLVKNFYLFQEILMLILYPIFIVMIFYSRDILILFFSEKWGKASFYLQMLSLMGMFNILVNWNILILTILGNSKQILRYEILMKILLFVCIGIVLLVGSEIKILLITLPLVPAISYTIYNYKVSALLHESIYRSMYSFLQYLLLSLVPVIILFFCKDYFIVQNKTFELMINLSVYSVLYILLIRLFKRHHINYFFIGVKSNITNEKN